MEKNNSELNELELGQNVALANLAHVKGESDGADVFSNLAKDTQAAAYYNLAKIYYDKADLVKAKEFFELCLLKMEFPRDVYTEFKILGFLVRIYSEMLDAEKTQEHIARSQLIMEKLSSELGSLSAEYFYNQGVTLTYIGKFAEARNSFLMAEQKSRQENEPNILAKTLYSLAVNHYQNKEYEPALRYLDQLKQLLDILQKAYMLGTMNLLLGNIYAEMEDFERAKANFDLASNQFRRKSCWNLMGYLFLGQGVLGKKMGDYKESGWYFNKVPQVIDLTVFKRLNHLLKNEINDLNDSNVDLYLDRTNRVIYEKTLGSIDFKHRFVLLEILFLLAQTPGTAFDKDALAKSIWKDEYNPLIHDKLIYTSISRLRKLIEPKGEKCKYILRSKDGYTFNPHVRTRFHREGRSDAPTNFGNVEISSPV